MVFFSVGVDRFTCCPSVLFIALQVGLGEGFYRLMGECDTLGSRRLTSGIYSTNVALHNRLDLHKWHPLCLMWPHAASQTCVVPGSHPRMVRESSAVSQDLSHDTARAPLGWWVHSSTPVQTDKWRWWSGLSNYPLLAWLDVTRERMSPGPFTALSVSMPPP